jgi:DNA polymerase (family 10)
VLKSQISSLLEAMADLLEVESDNAFRSRAFRTAARALEGTPGELEELLASDRLRSIPGIGPSIAKEIAELAATGSSARLREVEAAVPPGVRGMLRVPGLGPKKARKLWKELGIEDLGSLKAACQRGAIAAVGGFGEKSQQKILEGIEYIGSVSGQFRLDQALPYAQLILAHLKKFPALQRVEIAGSLRRGKETVKDVDILASAPEPDLLSDHFVKGPGVAAIVAKGETKTSVRLENGLAVDLRVVGEKEFPAALQYFTGSKEHNTALRGLAKDRGLKLNEYGLFRGEEALPLADEESIYRALGLEPIDPALRENLGEIELARGGSLPALLKRGDLKGMVHVHTTWSDGIASIESMVEAARERGYKYLGLTDHSQSAFYAGGLKPEKVREQHAEIDRLEGELADFRIFKGIESDIRADGSLDYDGDLLDSFDFVVASVHSQLQMSEEAMTRRVIRALEDPHTTILGHPTGRLLLSRESFPINMDKVLRAAAGLGVAVEINANPRRLDLDWRHGPLARELRLLTSINPDAHSPEGMDDVEYGVAIARKAGFSRERVLNALDTAGFEDFLARRKR